MEKINLKQKQKIVNKWISKHGAAGFNLKERDIILYDGGLFSIESKKVRRHKIIGHKRLSNGMVEILFSKNKPIKDIEHYAVFWIEELVETIAYLKSMERMLQNIGYDTKKSLKWQKRLFNGKKKNGKRRTLSNYSKN